MNSGILQFKAHSSGNIDPFQMCFIQNSTVDAPQPFKLEL